LTDPVASSRLDPSSPDRGDPLELIDFLRLIPKAELHCHLLGTVRYETFLDLAKARNAPLDRAEIDAFYKRGEKPAGAIRVLRALDQHLIAGPEDLYRITREYLEEARRHGVIYSEFFWNPTGTIHVSGVPYAAAQAAIVRAIREADTDFGITSRLIPSIDREADPEAAVEMVDLAIAHRVPEVVGIGMDYVENNRPPEMFWKAYRVARNGGLKTTAHAGEFGMKWTNIETAIDLLRVDRIDHGYTVTDNPDLARRCADLGILFTVVPTNTYYLRTLPPARWAADHPIRRLKRLGIRIHPNTDDPTLHDVTPTKAWHMMIEHFGCDIGDLRGFLINGLEGAWISNDVRRQWRREWLAEFDALRLRLTSPIPSASGG
jgi:adenine deaminase